MSFTEETTTRVLAAIKSAKTFKGAKEYESKKGNTGLVIHQIGGYAGEDIGTVEKDGKTYMVSLKQSITAREYDGPRVSNGSGNLL